MAGQINIKLNNYVIMILKLKKILFQSPNPSFLLKLCETKIDQICFLETSQNVSAEVWTNRESTKYLVIHHHIFCRQQDREGGMTIENIIFCEGGGERYELIKCISSGKKWAVSVCGCLCMCLCACVCVYSLVLISRAPES